MSVLLRRTLPSVSSSRAVLSLASSSRLPMAPSLAGSTSSVLSLLSSLSLSTPPPSSLTPLGRRSFSTTTTLCTPRLGLLKRKHRQGAGWDPTKSQKAKTHKGAQERFRCYKTGLFKHVRSGTNQLLRKNNHRQGKLAGVQVFLGKMQTRKMKKLMPYWKRTRRQGGW